MANQKFVPRSPDLKGKIQKRTDSGFLNVGEISLWNNPAGKYGLRGNIEVNGERLTVWIEAPMEYVEKQPEPKH